MRISDWSSDVCSSDLYGAERIGIDRHPLDGKRVNVPHDQRERGIHGQFFAIAGGNRRSLRVAQGGERRARFPGRWSLPPSSRARGQIGRASCRERVCQSVWISVGAVSYTKKKQ